jgi:hypothetical protein
VSDKVANESSTSMLPVTPDRSTGARILARTFYKELRSSGYTPKQLLALSSELIGLITGDLQKQRQGLTCAA